MGVRIVGNIERKIGRESLGDTERGEREKRGRGKGNN